MTAPPPFATLRRFLPRERAERCALCGAAIASEHPHLFEIAARRLVCACEACGILFDHRGATRYRRIGRDVRWAADFQMSEAEWDALAIPIGMAFFTYSSAASRVLAFYPGPAGAIESLLPLGAWPAIVARNPMAGAMEPDVEALLVNRTTSVHEYYVTPIDCCYRLVGILRRRWSGFSGGEEVWREIDSFFADLKERGSA